MNSSEHVVFVTNNMAARPFSVPKLVNGIMMANAPGAAAAEQKFNRLSTADRKNENKKAHMYWFNFKAMNLVRPLVNIIWNDIANKKNLKAANGQTARTMLDAIGIFDAVAQNGGTTTQSRWTKEDIFEEMRNSMNRHGSMVNALSNFAPDVAEKLNKMLAALSNDDFDKIEDVNLGKASIAEIDCGPTFNKNAHKKQKQPETPPKRSAA